MAWKPLAVLGTAQFLMVLDTSVMNVSVSQLVADFDTTVTAIQAVITLYTLVMAAFMITGGKLGDLLGRRRAFAIGLVIYGIGSGVTAIAPQLWVLTVGWSVIEGLGAALVLPALAALVGGNYAAGRDRAMAYGVIGGVAGAGIAVGPLLGGWVTTYLTWRLVFAGEVVLVIAMLLTLRWVADVPIERRPRLDWIGAALSAVGMALIVLGVLQSSAWGWVNPKNPPFTIFGFAPTMFVVTAGLVVLYLFAVWERRRDAAGHDPLVRMTLFTLPSLRSGLAMLLAQNLVLLGLFFAIPLYLQLSQGLDAFQTGVRLLPVSITMLVTALSGPVIGRYAGPRRIVRIGLAVLFVAVIWLVASVDPELNERSFGFAMALLGVGMGLLASQLGNIVQSSVGEAERGEVGGLQYTAQNLGSSLGTALVGAVLLATLAVSFGNHVADHPEISNAVADQAAVRIAGGVPFISTADATAALATTQVPPNEQAAIVSAYASAQLVGLKLAFLTAALFVLASVPFTRKLPERL
ncbi:MFS transporter [Hamadaea tsunoensis]|uniref:MFS transporter n=1 Tax=Hamadaea tsunoensis TaxID=53368 RepID=UPI00048A2616|nr:MFS transporter [Hamadaea tsunoensis]